MISILEDEDICVALEVCRKSKEPLINTDRDKMIVGVVEKKDE